MSRRAQWITVGAIAVVVIALSLAWFLAPRGSAEDQARIYLQALADGDVSAVRATGIDVPATTVSAFAQASGHLSDGEVESATADDHAAVIVVSYELAGARHESTLNFSQRGGHWVPDAAPALGSVKYRVPAAIADTILPPGRTLLLPAVYDVSATPMEFLDGRTTIKVLPGSTQEVDLDTTLRPDAVDAAQNQLDDYLRACTEPAAQSPSSCGIAIPWAADFSAVSEIRYRIEQTPVISITPSTFHADDGVLIATVTGTAPNGSQESFTYRTANWGVRGDVSFTTDDIVLSIW